MYYVYKILDDDDKIIYIGRSNNLKRRESEHNRCLRNKSDKQLYNYLNEKNITEIKLIEIRAFKTRVESKRYECYLILQDYFNEKTLQQKVPNISDR